MICLPCIARCLCRACLRKCCNCCCGGDDDDANEKKADRNDDVDLEKGERVKTTQQEAEEQMSPTRKKKVTKEGCNKHDGEKRRNIYSDDRVRIEWEAMLKDATAMRKCYALTENICCHLGIADLIGPIPIYGGVIDTVIQCFILCWFGRKICGHKTKVVWKGGRYGTKAPGIWGCCCGIECCKREHDHKLSGRKVCCYIALAILTVDLLRALEVGNLLLCLKPLKLKMKAQERKKVGKLTSTMAHSYVIVPSVWSCRYEEAILQTFAGERPMEGEDPEGREAANNHLMSVKHSRTNRCFTALICLSVIAAMATVIWAGFEYGWWTSQLLAVQGYSDQKCAEGSRLCPGRSSFSMPAVSKPTSLPGSS